MPISNTMTRFSKILNAAFVAALFGTAGDAAAQASATASATARIVTPIAISKTTDMNFGNVAVNATTAGTVILDTASARTATGGVTLPAVTGTVAAAVFNVSGEPSYTYAITLPSSALTISSTVSGTTSTMTVTAFNSFPSLTGTLSGSGSQTLKVGATLNVAAAQAAGTYTSGSPFTVTVNYN